MGGTQFVWSCSTYFIVPAEGAGGPLLRVTIRSQYWRTDFAVLVRTYLKETIQMVDNNRKVLPYLLELLEDPHYIWHSSLTMFGKDIANKLNFR